MGRKSSRSGKFGNSPVPTTVAHDQAPVAAMTLRVGAVVRGTANIDPPECAGMRGVITGYIPNHYFPWMVKFDDTEDLSDYSLHCDDTEIELILIPSGPLPLKVQRKLSTGNPPPLPKKILTRAKRPL
jgi:hypothetical protein